MEDNLTIWNAVSRPPKEALKQITGGRLSGMTDIKPQWRYKAMAKQFGVCGVGWKYTITREWTEQGSDSQILCFVNVDLFIKIDKEWSEAIPGTGGSMLVTKESKGLHSSDEGYKMALTDALSVAMGRIGVAAEIYMGNWTGSKYKDTPLEPKPQLERNWIEEIKLCDNMGELKAVFAEGYKATSVKEKADIKMEYDKKKVQFERKGE